jgi:hypothetical protein
VVDNANHLHLPLTSLPWFRLAWTPKLSVCPLLLNSLLTTLLPLQDPQEPGPSTSNCMPSPKMPHASRQGTTHHKLKWGTEATRHAKSDGDTVATQPRADVHPDSSEGLDLTSESKVIFFFVLLIYSYSLF